MKNILCSAFLCWCAGFFIPLGIHLSTKVWEGRKYFFNTRKGAVKIFFFLVQNPAVRKEGVQLLSQEESGRIFNKFSLQTLQFHLVFFPLNDHCDIIFCFHILSVQIPLASFYWGVWGVVLFFLSLFCSLTWNKSLSVFTGKQKLNVKTNIKLLPYDQVLGRICVWEVNSAIFWERYFGLNKSKI